MPKLYVIVRNDLPSLNAGKGMAQASHASAQFAYTYLINSRSTDVNNTFNIYKEYIENWFHEGKGFGTTIVLEGSKLNIQAFMLRFNINKSCISGTILDESYPFMGQKELLDLFGKSNLDAHQIHIEDDTVDKYGMVKCTRPETTCVWFFDPYDDDNNPNLKDAFKSMGEYGIQLHR